MMWNLDCIIITNYRDDDPKTGRYIQSDPIGLNGGSNTYSYVHNSPLMYNDPKGEMPNGSGQWTKVPGTNSTVRIDGPHVQNQQTHAHIRTKGKPEIAINIDGTPSHGSDLSKMSRNKKLLEYLRKFGFKLGMAGDLCFIKELVDNVSDVQAPNNPLCGHRPNPIFY